MTNEQFRSLMAKHIARRIDEMILTGQKPMSEIIESAAKDVAEDLMRSADQSSAGLGNTCNTDPEVLNYVENASGGGGTAAKPEQDLQPSAAREK